jgi:hypothetical protein
MTDLYDTDILAWSERQGALLRSIAAGERVNDADLDWPNIAEEIESVGRTETRSCASHLTQALLHDLKAKAWPDSREAEHWLAEARQQRDEARDAYSPSMRGKIDIAKLYVRALRWLPRTIDGQPPLPVPAICPVTLDELLADE